MCFKMKKKKISEQVCEKDKNWRALKEKVRGSAAAKGAEENATLFRRPET